MPGARLRLAMTPAKLSRRLQGSAVSPRSCLSLLQQGKNVLREPVTGTRLEADVIPVFAPAAVQQAEQVVVEKVEERRPYTDALRMFIGHLLQVIGGQW